MKIFLTGASGFIGSAVLKELLEKEYEVVSLARSEAAKEKILAIGGEVVIGDLESTEIIAEAAKEADGVIHLGFIHDWANMENSSRIDREVIQTIGDALVGTEKAFIVTSAIGQFPAGELKKETDAIDKSSLRGPSETTALTYQDKGVRVMIVRPAPSVHEDGHSGFIDGLFDLAKQNGRSYYAEGAYHWSAVHLADIATLYRLAIEKGKKGAAYHGVAESDIPLKSIAEKIGESLGLPVEAIADEEAPGKFTWLAKFTLRNVWGDNELTKAALGWEPTHLGLLEDLEQRK